MTAETPDANAAHDRVAALQRWEEAGAHWRLIARRRDAVTIAMLRCDGGEEVERFTSSDPALLSFLGDRFSSSD